MRRTIGTCVFAVMASACVSYGGRYPLNWPDPAVGEPGRCQAIDGEYRDVGERFEELDENQYVQEPASLGRLLGGWGDPEGAALEVAQEEPDYRAVGLKRSGDRLLVSVYPREGEIKVFSVPVLEPCEESLVELVPDWTADSVVFLSLVGRASLKLGRAADGSLLINARSTGSMVFLYAPLFWGKDETWFRFAQVKEG